MNPRPVTPSSRLARKRPSPLALEPRLIFDADTAHPDTHAPVEDGHAATADAVTSDLHPILDQSLPDHPALAEAVTPEPPLPKEVVFIDTSVADWQTLASNVKPGAQVFLLDPNKDGLAQIETALEGLSNVSSIHIVSHGAEGSLLLAGKSYTAESIANESTVLSAIGHSLTPDGDILLYGCDIGTGASGAALLGRIAETTGGDVAASIDATGTASVGGNWILERATGKIESSLFITERGEAAYGDWLSTIPLNGKTGWTAIMYGPSQDPVGDSQAGAADTDIVGDGNHGSLYTAYDNNGTDNPADDYIAFRLRIDNPTSSTNFGGVAIVGLDVNNDGRVDVFISVDGRNNTQAVRILDPGTGANISPSTTSTSPLPTGWLANNGVYPFAASNYSVVEVSSATDPHWNGVSDIGSDGKTDVFVSWKIPVADLAIVLAKPSPVDRNGIYGPRGSTGIAGYDQNTVVRYVSFTQTQPGPINGDLNGVGASYDRNASFSSLGAFTAPMSASTPVAAGPVLSINSPNGGAVLNDAQDESVTISGTSTYLPNKALTVTVTDGVTTVTGNTTTASDGTWSVTGMNLSGLNDGSLTVTATVADPDANPATNDAVLSSASLLHDKTAPAIAIDPLATAISGRPTFSGTSDLPDGSLVTITIDADNNAATTNLVYQVLVSGGVWTLNTSTVSPVSGTMPTNGLTSYTKVTASATDAAGNSATAIALDRPTINTLSTNSTTPTISGTWMYRSGDVLTITVSGATYTLAPSGNTWSLNLATATPTSGSLTPLVAGQSYEVVATVTRSGTSVNDTTTAELAITSTPIITIGIDGGATVNGSNTSPTITGTSQNAGGYVIVRLDPGNDGDLSDAVTYSITPDGSGNWTLNTSSATPISGQKPAAGFIGAVGVYATDSTGVQSAGQVLNISTPSIAISGITSGATANSSGVISNTGGGQSYLNLREDDSVTISGTATNGFTVDVVITDVNGHSLSYSNIAVSSGTWSISGKDLSTLDNGTLTVTATLSGTGITTSNTAVTHDKTAPQIFFTTPSEIKKAAPVISGGSELPNTSLTVSLYASSGGSLLQTAVVTTDSAGRWSTTTLTGFSGNPSSVFVSVSPTSQATDAAGNIAQTVTMTQTTTANAATNSISIGAIAGDNAITADEITANVALAGTTTLTGSGTATVTITDGTTTVTKSSVAYSNGTWSTSLTPSEIRGFQNGQLRVTATALDGSITIKDIAFVSLSLPAPTLVITDNVAGTAAGPITFTFTFSEAVTGFDASDITLTGGTKGTFSGSGTTYTLVVNPTSDSSGNIVVSVASSVATGSTTGRANASASESQPYNTTSAAAAPSLTIDTTTLATDETPVITGTTSLSAGAPVVIAIDTDNDGVTDLTYSAIVQSGGSWTLDTSTATPTAGTFPTAGLSPYAKITATATNAYGISTNATGLNKPTVATSSTNDSTPTVTGTWTQVSGDTLNVVVNGVTYSVGNGNLAVTSTGWSLTPTVALADGTYSVTATVTRSGGGSAVDPTASELAIDTLAAVTISGGATTDISGDATPVISGTTSGIPAGTVLTVSLDIDNNGSTDVVYKTVIASDGSWSVDTSSATPYSGSFPAAGLSGEVKLTAVATDPAGNAGTDTQVLTVDVTGPEIALTINSKTSDTTPLITGTTDLPGGSTITVEIDPNNDGNWSDHQVYTATVNQDGTWSVEATTAVSGTVGVRASGSDTIGNATITAVKPLEIVLNAPTITLTVPNTSIGSDNSADVNEDDSIVFNGSTANIAVGSTISVTITDGTITISDTAIVQSDGSWALAALNLSNLASGSIAVTATVVDTDGSAYSDHASFAHDKTATVAIDSISEDTGVLSDFVTKDSTVSISGSATANQSVAVVVRDSNNSVVATFNVTASSTGSWSTAATSALTHGEYTIEATVSGITATKAMTIVDSTPPSLTSSTPADDSSNVAIGSNLTLLFDKNVQAGTGYASLYRNDGTLIENFNVSTGSGDAGGTLTFSGTNGLLLNPGSDLVNSTGYYLRVDNTAIIDAAGNAYAGISNSTTLNFTTAAPGYVDTTPPVITGPSGSAGAATSAKTIDENTTAVATLSADESVTWSIIGGTDQGKFTIDSTTGALSFISAPDYESPTDSDHNNTYLIQVRGTDSSGNHSEQTITVTVADVDDVAPTITGPSGNPGDGTASKTINENTTAVATLTADEPGTWSIVGGVDQSKFTIDAITGALRFISAPDYESPTDSDGNNAYVVEVRVTDGSGNHSEQTITVTVADLDEVAPTITGPSGNPGDATATKTVSENITAVTTLTSSESVSWSIVGGADQVKFTIDSTTGALRFISTPDYESPTDSDGNNTYLVQVRATDGSGNHSEQTITVTVADVDESVPDVTPPVITGPSGNPGDLVASKTINENITVVATLSANESVTWSLVGGADQSKFTIDSTTGALRFISAPDYESPTDSDGNNTYLVQVRATDGSGNHSEQTITVTVADVDESVPDVTPPIITGPSGNPGDSAANKTINENITAVATLGANESVTWSLVGGADQSKFTIDSTTGALRFISAPDYECPTDSDGNNTYLVQVRATDGNGNHSDQTITVTVANLDESVPDITPPVITGPSGTPGDATASKTVNENTTSVTTFTANESVTWSIVGGIDQTKFEIDPLTGALRFTSAPDYEAPADSDHNNTYLVQIRATDASGNHSEQTVTVSIADVAEGPVASVVPNTSVEVGSALDPLVAPAFVSGDGVTLHYSASLADGTALPSWLTFDPTSRTFSGTPPAGTSSADLSIKVTASDGHLSANATFTLKITLPTAPLGATDRGDATEAGGIGHAEPGIDAVGNAIANDTGSGIVITDIQNGTTLTSSGATRVTGSTQLTNSHGTLIINPDGSYRYLVDNTNAEVVALNTGENLVDTFTYRIVDKAGQSSTATLTITIHGVTDQLPPVVPNVPAAPQPVDTPVALPPLVPEAAPVASLPTLSAPVGTDAASSQSSVGDLGQRSAWAPPAAEGPSFASTHTLEMPVLPGETTRLVVFRGVPDQFSESETVIRFTIPADAFAHEKEASDVIFAATMIDGTSLPEWLVFDRVSGTFSGIAPRGFTGELKIKVIARDAKGQQAEAIFRFTVGRTSAPNAKLGLSSQMRGLTYLNSKLHGFDVALK